MQLCYNAQRLKYPKEEYERVCSQLEKEQERSASLQKNADITASTLCTNAQLSADNL